MNRQMTDEEAHIVEQNHNLIYSYMKNHNLVEDESDDWYGVLAIGLCQAAMHYDKNRDVCFSTFAYKCMDSEVKEVMRKRKGVLVCSFEEEVTKDGELRLIDILKDPVDFTDGVCIRDIILKAMASFNKRDRSILILRYIYNTPVKDISKEFGVTSTRISQICSKFVDRVRQMF